jgi:Dolichyl-phosphate-mannose-protein mannosyltransferase
MASGARAHQPEVESRPRHARASWVTAALLLAAAWPVWTHRLGVIDLDDAASNEVLFARRPLPQVIDVPWNDQSPGAFVLLHYWRKLGEDPATVKLLNLVLLTASLLVFHAVARRLCRPRVALAAILLAVLSPASLWLARNGRMYSLQLLLWTIGLLFMARYAQSRRPADLAGLTAATLLGIYNHFIGYVSAATVVLWLVVEAVAGSRSEPPEDRAMERRRRLGPPLAVALALGLLAEPETMRLLAVLRAPPPVVAGQALPGGWLHYLDAVSSFWFMNGGWGSLEPHARALRAAYLAAAYLLFVMGLARGSARMRRLVVVTVLFPLAAIGLAAGRLDFRDRHLFYMLPLVWLAIANGALGGEAEEAVPVPRRVAAAAVGLLLALGAASAWLLHAKLPERYVEWTKLMQGVLQVHRPGTAVYMTPSPFTGSPELIASRLAPTAGFVIRPLDESTRLDFLAAASEKRDCLLLRQEGTPGSPERDWRVGHLTSLGYRRLALAVTGADAELFTAGEGPALSSVGMLGPRPSVRAAVDWARGRLRDPSRPRHASALGRGLVARVDAGGTAREATFFMSQGGESGYWRLSAADHDRVEEVRTPIDGVDRPAILAGTTDASLLLIAAAGTEAAEGLGLTCASWPVSPADPRGVVSAQVFVDGEEAILATCPLGRWETAAARIPGGTDGRVVTVALSAVGMDRADVAFHLAATRPPAPDASARTSPLPAGGLSAGHTLKDEISRLRVFRTAASGFGRVPGRYETVPRSAAVMHEAGGAGAASGGIGARWELGELPWDAVGLTLQASGDDARWGLWAHPRAGTTLVIETGEVALPRGLEGFYGLTDVAVDQGMGAGVTDPIELRVLLDGRPVLARTVPRARGWVPFATAAGQPLRGRLRIEVASARDTWAHFVFDLWPRGAPIRAGAARTGS